MTPPDVKVCPACGGQGAYRDWLCPTCSRGEVVVSRALLERVRGYLQHETKWHAERHCPGNGGYAAEGVCICADMENIQAALAELEGVLRG